MPDTSPDAYENPRNILRPHAQLLERASEQIVSSTQLINSGKMLIARTVRITRLSFPLPDRRSDLCPTGGFEHPDSRQIQNDGYRLIRAAHRLSSEAAVAVKVAKPDALHRLWKIHCPPAIAQELWTWFDDCEQYSALLPREGWKVRVCQRAKERIARAA